MPSADFKLQTPPTQSRRIHKDLDPDISRHLHTDVEYAEYDVDLSDATSRRWDAKQGHAVCLHLDALVNHV
jgi:hypothetical protein